MAENIHTFLNSFDQVKERPYGSGQYICRCPAHDDKKASLSIKDETRRSGRILLHCQAGCSTDDVLSAIGKTIADIQPAKDPERKLQSWQRNLVAEYRYKDINGKYLYSKLRYEGEGIDGKEIRYGRIINDQFQSGKGDTGSELYNLPDLRKGIKAGRRIYLVEGEKDVETLRQYGMIAVTAGGCSDWKSHYADRFIGASDVVIIADRDEAGQKLAQQISRDLRSVVYSHRIITPSGLMHGDVTDYMTEESGTTEDLLQIIEQTAPIMASWVMTTKSRSTVNVDLLAAEILKRNNLFIARNPGTKSDLIFWYEDGAYKQMSETEISGKVRSWLPVGRATPDTISKVSKMILYSAEVKQYGDLNSDERYMNVRNGLLDIRSGELKQYNPELISTLQLNCDYKPGATAARWIDFVRSLCWDPESEQTDIEMIDVIQEWTGLVLSPIYGYRVKKCLIMFSPQGNTGKSVFLSVIGGMLGKDAIANVSFKDLGSSRWATGRAFSKRCIAVGDEGGDRVESSAIFKQLTGGDVVSAEMKGLQGFDFRFRGVIIAACNVLPYFDDDKGDHVADRLMILHCRHTVPAGERDPLLVDKLLQEKEGILQWAWEGLQRFISNGMHFSQCRSSEALTSEYRARYDTMYAFLKDQIDVTGNRRDCMKKTDLETMYFAYCQEQDLIALNKKNIPQRLASLGISKAIRDGYAVYIGVIPKAFIEVDQDHYPPF